jgi:acetyl esterase
MSMPTPYLDPLNQAVADEFATQPPLQDLSIEQFRKLFEQLQEHTPNPAVTRTSFTVPFEDGVKTFVFKAKGMTGTLPVIFFFHGGGWIAGRYRDHLLSLLQRNLTVFSVNSYDSICRDLALQTGYAVVFVEYTLAPEAQFPTQQEQCYAVLKWVSEHGHTKGLSTINFAIIGDSAGGQLTPAVSILASTRKPTIPIKFQVLLSPVTDLLTLTIERETTSEFELFNGPLITVPFLQKCIANYAPNAKDQKSELASPRLISPEHAKKQPPTLIINSAVDPLRDDGLLFGQILHQAGIDCSIVTMHGQLHDSSVLEATRNGPTPKTTIELITAKIKLALGEKSNKRKAEVGEQEMIESVETKNAVSGKKTASGKQNAVNGRQKRLRSSR